MPSTSLVSQVQLSHEPIFEGGGCHCWSFWNVSMMHGRSCDRHIDTGWIEVRGKIANKLDRVEVKVAATLNDWIAHSIVAELEGSTRLWIVDIAWSLRMSAFSTRRAGSRCTGTHNVGGQIAHAWICFKLVLPQAWETFATHQWIWIIMKCN